MLPIKLEVCVDTLAGALEADAGGADRLELCAALSEGGLTPSIGLLRVVKQRVKCEVFAMIRPRGGDFLYSADELRVMAEDIDAMRELADGFVFGCLTDEGDLDADQNQELLIAARGKPCTLHRAIDVSRDPIKAAFAAAELGFTRILTSGHEDVAEKGLEIIRQMQQTVGEKLVVMPGSGVTAANAAFIVQRTEATEIHSSCSNECDSLMTYIDPNGTHKWRQANRELVEAMRSVLRPFEKRELNL